MQPENQQRPRYMIDEYYNIGRPISPVVHIIAESRHGRGIGLKPEDMVDMLRAYGRSMEMIFSRYQSEDTIDYDII